jgi:collagenase-like PrtC family protease
MTLMAPANYDVEVLPQLAARSVREIYGRLTHDVVGGGRPAYMAGPLNRKKLQNYIDAVAAAGMEFNYLLNSACLGNREWTKAFQRGLRRDLDWLTDIGVRRLTIATPYLVQLITKHYPHFKIKVGIYAQVDTVKRAQYWQDLGVDGIVLESFSINRDFDKLEKIRKAVSCELVLIANHFCQPNCAYQIQHQNGHSHASGGGACFYMDFPLIQCQYERLTDPKLMIAAQWIRPEDLRHYEALGFSTFKLLERNIPSAELLKRADAYHSRRFEGNLAELIFSWGFQKKAPGFRWLHFVRTFRPWHTSSKFRKAMVGFLHSQGMLFPKLPGDRPPIEIRNEALPREFLDWFKRKNCADTDCALCGFCEKVARTAVRLDPEFLGEVLPLYEKVQADLIDGKFLPVAS